MSRSQGRVLDEPETTGSPTPPKPRGTIQPALSGQFAGGHDRPDAYELLGDGIRGGEGVTWRALDHTLRTPVLCAVKRLFRPMSAGADWPTAADRLRLEQQKRLLQHLALANVVRVHDVLCGPPPHPQGRPDPSAPSDVYVIMEWVEGPTLRQLVGGRPATSGSLMERLKYVSQLAGALAELMPANGNATLHRDVKPGNCIIHERRGLVLIDVTTLRPADDGFDAAGLHTPRYAAPEVLDAPRRPRTTATEMYSIGAVAAFCLTGVDPVPVEPTSPHDRWLSGLLTTASDAGVPDPEAFVRHLTRALETDPASRPTDLRRWSDTLIQLAIRTSINRQLTAPSAFGALASETRSAPFGIPAQPGETPIGANTASAPKRDPWTVALHTDPADPHGRAPIDPPIGTGVLIDAWRVLTTASTMEGRHTTAHPIWVAFPKAGVDRRVRRRVLSVRADATDDIAVLVLAEPAPAEAKPAPLLCPDGTDLVGEPWWAFGFPADTPYGSDAHGVIGSPLAYGRVRLDTESRLRLADGFTGAAVWSPRFQAIVALVGRVHAAGDRAGDAVALTMLQAGHSLPEERLHDLAGWSVLDAGESALAAWGWSLDADVEADRHWRPRARGVAVETEAGYRFRGRRTALSAVVGWLDRRVLDDRVLVVTGSPGVGKSAVLGRVVTTADAAIRAALPEDDHNVVASVGSVACAVHVKGKTALDVAVEIARAAAVRLPHDVSDLVPALRRRLADRHLPQFNLVVDALDEAVSPDQARQVIEGIVVPIVRTCWRLGAQVVVGTRRSDDDGDLLPLFGPDCGVIDLDSERYFEVRDLAAYAMATLQLVGAERRGNPYASAQVAAPVAARIAQLADRNFLVAGLIARRHGLYDTAPARPDQLAFPPDVDTALEAYVHRLPPVGPAPAKLALTALAYAHAPGLSLDLWQTVLVALGPDVGVQQLEEFAHSSAANFLVETSGDHKGRRFRLFHQALNDALLRERQENQISSIDQRAISDRLIRHGRHAGWSTADPYLLRSLPEHAAAGGLIDELLIDDEFLLYADLLRLIAPADYAHSMLGQQRARLLRLTPQAATADPAERAAQFSITAALEGLDTRLLVSHDAPYRAAWAAVQQRLEWAVLEGHTNAVNTVCALTTRSQRTVLASGGADGTVRIWNPVTGQQERLLLAGSAVMSMRPIAVAGHTLLASAGADGMVVLWDPDTGQPRHTHAGRPGQIQALTEIIVRGQPYLGVVSADGSMIVWDPAHACGQTSPVHTGRVTAVESCGAETIAAGGADGTIQLWALDPPRNHWTVQAHHGPVTALCRLATPGHNTLASAGADGTVRLWDADTGQPRSALPTLSTMSGTVQALCPMAIRGIMLLATAGDDGTVRLWDPNTGELRRVLPHQGSPIRDLCAVKLNGRLLLVSVGDSAVRLWDPDLHDRRADVTSRSTEVTALTAVWHGNKELVACGRGDGSVHLRTAATGHHVRVLTGHDGPVTGLTAMFASGRIMLASASADDTIGVWTLDAARQRPHREHRPGWSTSVCAVLLDHQVFLACAGSRGTVRLWQPYTGKERRRTVLWRFRRCLNAHASAVSALCTLEYPGETRIASAGHDGTVRVWNLDTGQPLIVFNGHHADVRAASAITVRGHRLIASGGDDQIILIWDPHTGRQLNALQGHTGRITGLCPILVNGRALLASTSHDGTARIWDPAAGSLEITIPVHHEATGCVAAADRLIIGLTAGTLAISLNT